jgi:Domain of unknown function (DUF4390)
MVRHSIVCLVVLGFLGVARLAGADGAVKVVPVPRAGHLVVTFGVDEAFSDEMRRSIQSGLETTFTYDVELRRASSVWIDRVLASTRLAVVVRYDNLTRRYQASLVQDGRVQRVTVTGDERTIRRMATRFDKLPLFSTRPLEQDGEYYVRVRAHQHPRSSFLFAWPWDWAWGRVAALASATFRFVRG